MSEAVVNLFSRSTAGAKDIYLRNNLASKGSVPFSPPLGLCPDIIQSETPVPGFENEFSSIDSWQKSYNVEPAGGRPNYYYVRGMNGSQVTPTDSFSLYYSQAQVFMLPASFKGNLLSTESGAEASAVTAPPGHIGVGEQAFVWTPPLVNRDGYFNLIAQLNSGCHPDPVPPVSNWLDLAKLIGQTPTFGFRNQAVVSGNQWVRRQELRVPASFASTALTITLSATGLTGTTVCLLCDTVAPNQKPIVLGPLTVPADGQLTGAQFTIPAGYTANLAVQFWNLDNVQVAPGSTLRVTFGYPVTTGAEFERAVQEQLVNHSFHDELSQPLSASIQPKAMAIVSQLTFTTGS
ncbi:hypothetical protein [Pseudomonas sp. GL-R-19]|uniref:hypothetical protein n=1 Tax=Pseudomonas sp. GL-R-19 TaxID=2832391 RepID=UPI001CBABFF0|nr:hypothetical protein [Pseudomonas sp. GL-R-19]